MIIFLRHVELYVSNVDNIKKGNDQTVFIFLFFLSGLILLEYYPTHVHTHVFNLFFLVSTHVRSRRVE